MCVLLSAFPYFHVSFMVWALLGALGTFIAEDMGLSASQKGLITAIPLLAGSRFRLILGPLLGVAGASVAVPWPLASRWYPPERQSLAMGWHRGRATAVPAFIRRRCLER